MFAHQALEGIFARANFRTHTCMHVLVTSICSIMMIIFTHIKFSFLGERTVGLFRILFFSQTNLDFDEYLRQALILLDGTFKVNIKIDTIVKLDKAKENRGCVQVASTGKS